MSLYHNQTPSPGRWKLAVVKDPASTDRFLVEHYQSIIAPLRGTACATIYPEDSFARAEMFVSRQAHSRIVFSLGIALLGTVSMECRNRGVNTLELYRADDLDKACASRVFGNNLTLPPHSESPLRNFQEGAAPANSDDITVDLTDLVMREVSSNSERYILDIDHGSSI